MYQSLPAECYGPEAHACHSPVRLSNTERGGGDAHVIRVAPAISRDTGTCTYGAHDCRARRVLGLKLAEVLRETG